MGTSSFVYDFVQLFTSALGVTDVALILMAILLVFVLQGSRQKRTTAPTKTKASSVWQMKKKSPGKPYESDTAMMSTDVGDFSASEFSDRSTDASGTSNRRHAPNGPRTLKQRLNADAACFVPSSNNFGAAAPSLQSMLSQGQNPQQLRESIKMLKGALDEWEANLPPEAPIAHDDKNALLEALAKLTPDQASTVRSMLDSKLASHGAQVPSYRQSGACMPPPSHRPFTPFGLRQTNAPTKGSRPNPPKVPSTQDGPEEESLRTQLRDLAAIENERVLMVRRINRLGLESAVPLKSHFEQFGSVERVMVAPTRSKTQAGQTKVRVRPAPLGFVVMKTVEEASAALAHGSDHEVQGVNIGVFPFTTHDIDQ